MTFSNGYAVAVTAVVMVCASQGYAEPIAVTDADAGAPPVEKVDAPPAAGPMSEEMKAALWERWAGLHDAAGEAFGKSDYAAALAPLQQALTLARKLEPTGERFATTARSLAAVQMHLKNYPAARDLLAEALPIIEKTTPKDPAIAQLRQTLAQLEKVIANQPAAGDAATGKPAAPPTHSKNGPPARPRRITDPKQSLPLLEAELKKAAAEHGPDSVAAADVHQRLEQTHRALKKTDAALTHGRAALTIYSKKLGPDHAKTANAHMRLAELLMMTGQPDAAGKHLKAALAGQEKAHGKDSDPVLRTLKTTLNYQQTIRDLDGAAATTARMRRLYETRQGPASDMVGKLSQNLGVIHDLRGQRQAALDEFARASQIFEKVHGVASTEVADVSVNIGRIHHLLDQDAKAVPYLMRAVKIYEKQLGPKSRKLGHALTAAAIAQRQAGAKALALKNLTRSLAVLEKAEGQDSPALLRTLDEMALLLHARKQTKNAKQLESRAAAIRKTHDVRDQPSFFGL